MNTVITINHDNTRVSVRMTLRNESDVKSLMYTCGPDEIRTAEGYTENAHKHVRLVYSRRYVDMYIFLNSGGVVKKTYKPDGTLEIAYGGVAE